MAENIPHLNYDMVARYEWFRRSVWGPDEQAWLIPMFAALTREHGFSSCLFAGGALGRTALAFAKQCPGLALAAYLPSSYGVERARELAKANNLNCSFLSGDRAEIAGDIPHPVDCVFSPNWMSEPEWGVLKSQFESAFAALNPGGVMAFPSPQPNGSWMRMLEMYDNWSDDHLLWHFRDGAKECLCLRSKAGRADNYADIKYSFIAINHETTAVETTVKRLPAYWNWDIVCGLAADAGFIDCAAYEVNGQMVADGVSVLFVAHKPGAKKTVSAAPDARMSAYADF